MAKLKTGFLKRNIGICLIIFDNAIIHLFFFIQLNSLNIKSKSVSKFADVFKELDILFTVIIQDGCI